MHACSLISLSEDMNSSVGITGLRPKGIPVQEALSTFGIYFTGILLREGGNWDVSFLVVKDQNIMCSVQTTGNERIENFEILKILHSRTSGP